MDQLLKEVVDLTKQMKVKILVCENKLEKSFWHTNLRYKPRSNVTVAESNNKKLKFVEFKFCFICKKKGKKFCNSGGYLVYLIKNIYRVTKIFL